MGTQTFTHGCLAADLGPVLGTSLHARLAALAAALVPTLPRRLRTGCAILVHLALPAALRMRHGCQARERGQNGEFVSSSS